VPIFYTDFLHRFSTPIFYTDFLRPPLIRVCAGGASTGFFGGVLCQWAHPAWWGRGLARR